MPENVFSRLQPPTAMRLAPSPPSGGKVGAPPVAFGAPAPAVRTGRDLGALLAPYRGKSVGQSYPGPSWVDETGMAWVVLVATDISWPRAIRQAKKIAIMTWRWDVAPSCHLSLSAVVPGNSKLTKPAPRWFGESASPTAQAIRRKGEFMALVAHPDGVRSDWMLAQYEAEGDIGLAALERQFERIRAPGIPRSRLGVRFDPSVRPAEPGNAIPLWTEPVSDFWATLNYAGPWAKELGHVDQLQGAWGRLLLRARGHAAGVIEQLRDRFAIDGEQPFFSADGTPTSRIPEPAFSRLMDTAGSSEHWARLASAVAGPSPDACQAFEAAIACISEPHNCWSYVSMGMGVLPDIDDAHLMPAFKMFLECALLSPQVSQQGLAKPWLANTPSGLVLKAIPLDTTCSEEAVRSYWQQGLELHELLDSGLWARGGDFPLALERLAEAMAGTTVEGGPAAAEARAIELLQEAIEARQWTIPWGARVELALGPFTGMHIYDTQGEFACVFEAGEGRYHLVSLGLRDNRPQLCSARIPLPRASTSAAGSRDEGEAWDLDSQATLELVAAAIVRDFLVVEERESVFGARVGSRKVRGHEVATVIYLPRVLYHRQAPRTNEHVLQPSAGAKSAHAVTHHLRRAGTASAEQRFLAQRYGVRLPAGFTFVRPHERGSAASQERIQVYRSRSASQMLFEAVATAPAGARPAWFEFEKDCARLMRSRGLEVVHTAVNRDGDGGVDLYATHADGQGWVVQCKCWGLHRPVGPEVIRELHGAIALADADAATPSKGVVITTSRFTREALETAAAFGYECIDGAAFARLASS